MRHLAKWIYFRVVRWWDGVRERVFMWVMGW